MPVAWHSNRWWDWCVSEDQKKEIDPMFIKELWKEWFGSMQIWGIETFCLSRYSNIYKPSLIKILTHNFMINWFKYFD